MNDQLRLIFLGTGASVPSLRRSLPLLAIQFDGKIILCDCSEGAQMRIARAGLSPTKIGAIFISHLHGDHIFGLAGFLTSQQMMSRSQPLMLVSPPGVQKFLSSLKEISGFAIDYPLKIDELSGDTENLYYENYQIKAKLLSHGPSRCYGFRFIEPQKPGKFDEEKANYLKIPPGPERADLVRGKSIALQDGRIIQPDEVVGKPHPGRIITFCTDTIPCPASIELAENADMLIHDATFSDRQADWANETGHSTARQAAQIAAQANVRQLVLWHISMRNDESEEKEMLQQAQEEFENTILPADFQSMEILRQSV